MGTHYTWDLNEFNRTDLAPRTDNAPRRSYEPQEAADHRTWQEQLEALAAADTLAWEGPRERRDLYEDEPLEAQAFVIPPRAPGLSPRRSVRRRWLREALRLLLAVGGWLLLAAVLSGGWR